MTAISNSVSCDISGKNHQSKLIPKADMEIAEYETLQLSDSYVNAKLFYSKHSMKSSVLIDTGSKSSLISYHQLLRLGKMPPIKPLEIPRKIKGASGSFLEILGQVTLNLRLGQRELPTVFLVVRNLVTSCILGRKDQKRFRIVLDTENDTCILKPSEVCNAIEMGNSNSDILYQLHNGQQHNEILCQKDYVLMPGETKYIQVKPADSITFYGTYHIIMSPQYASQTVNGVIDLYGKSKFTVPFMNNTKRKLKLHKYTTLGTVQAFKANDEVLCLSDVLDCENALECENGQMFESCLATKKSKSRVIQKPTFSKPIRSMDPNLTVEQYVRKNLRYNKKLLDSKGEEKLVKLVMKHIDAFSIDGTIGRSKSFEYRLELQPGAKLQHRQPFRLSPFEQELMDKEMSKFRKMGVIEDVNDILIPGCAPALLVAKRDSSARVVVDFRWANSQLVKDHFPFPRISDLILKVGQSTYFSSFDLSDSFHQIPLEKSSRPLTTFTSGPNRVHRYRVCPQGLCNSPMALSHMTKRLFSDLPFVESYADDFVCHSSESVPKHLDKLEEVFIRVKNDNIKLNLEKCILLDNKLEFVGHNIENGKVSPLQRHIDSIINMPFPDGVGPMKRLLGCANYIRDFVPNYTAKTACLYALLKKGVEYKVTEKHLAAFNELKQWLTTKPVLNIPKEKCKFKLFIDGSRVGIGGVLVAEQEGRHDIIGYASKSLNSHEQNKSSVTELELMALNHCLKYFRHYLLGPIAFEAYSDHRPLLGIFQGKTPAASRKIYRMVSECCSFNFDLHYIEGIRNHFADMLSRLKHVHPSESVKIEEMYVTSENTETVPVRRSRRVQGLTPEYHGLSSPSRPRKQNVTVSTPPPPTQINDTPPLVQNNVHLPQVTPTVQNTLTPTTDNVPPPIILRSHHKPRSISPTIFQPVTQQIDKKHEEKFPNPVTYYPDFRPLFSPDPSIKFDTRFHGSVPPRAREKVREICSSQYYTDISKQTIINELQNDPYYRDIYLFLKHKRVPSRKDDYKRVMLQATNHVLIGDCLFKIPRPDQINDPRSDNLRLVIPDKLAPSIIANVHSNLMGASHSSFVRTLNMINRRYQIHDLGNLLKNYMDSCGTCLRFKKAKQGPNLPLKITAGKSSTGPFQFLQIDHCGPINSNKYPFRHILVITDEWSQYTWLRPVISTGAEEVAKNLVGLMKIHGCFIHLASDRGSAFTSQIMQNVTKLFKIKHAHDSAKSPSSTGLCEHKVKICKKLMKFAMLKDPSIDPYDTLADVQFSMNNAHSQAIGTSAYFAVHGRHPRTSLESNLNLDPLPASQRQFMENIKREAELRNEIIKEARTITSEKMKARYDSKIKSMSTLQAGDLCMYETDNHYLDRANSRSMKVPKKGPFKILAINDTYNAVLADMHNRVFPDLVPVRKLQKIMGYTENFPIDVINNVEDYTCIYCDGDHILIPGDRVIFKENKDFQLSGHELPQLFRTDDNDFESDTVMVTMTIGKSKIKTLNGEEVSHRLCHPVGCRKAGVYIPENLLEN